MGPLGALAVASQVACTSIPPAAVQTIGSTQAFKSLSRYFELGAGGRNVYGPGADKVHHNFSFSGAGWLKVYHFGAAKALQERGMASTARYAGASAGALVCVGLIIEADFDAFLKDTITSSEEVRSDKRKMMNMRSGLENMVDKHIGPHFHLYQDALNDRLEIAVSALPNTPLRLRNFDTYAQLRTALMASCTIPLITGLPRKMDDGHWGVDGGVTDNQPVIDTHTVTISPRAFSSADIKCKHAVPWWWFVMPPGPDDLKRLFRWGYEDTHTWANMGCKVRPKGLGRTSALFGRWQSPSAPAVSPSTIQVPVWASAAA